MLVTTRYQVDQGKQPQVVFKQLPLVQTRRRRKGKEPMSIQSPKSIPKVLCDPSGDLIELSTPLASPKLDIYIYIYIYEFYNGSTIEESK